MAKLEVEEQGPAKSNAIEHVGKDVHFPRINSWTIRHNVWTIAL
jgi:hypothetical protein